MPRRALFLDKDGVINVDHGYVCAPEHTDFIGGIFELCRAANENGWLVIVVTNQAGIARGRYTVRQFLDYMDWMRGQFAFHAARLDAVYHCPHHPVHGLGEYLRDCECRKPKPGMLLAAQREWNIDMPNSLLVGDSDSDVAAGMAAGVGKCLMARAILSEDSGRTVFDSVFLREAHDLLRTRQDTAI